MRTTLRLTFITLLAALAVGTLGASERTSRWATAKHIHQLVRHTTPPDSVAEEEDDDEFDTFTLEHHDYAPIPASYYGPVVFDRYLFLDTLRVGHSAAVSSAFPGSVDWLNDELNRRAIIESARQQYLVESAPSVRFNMASLPAPPPVFKPKADPKQHKFHIPVITKDDALGSAAVNVDQRRQNWINTLATSLQFSQSYISPNWYQGGNGNLNSIGQIVWTNKLNQAFHPKLMFETTVQYKLALNNAPQDSIHSYNISEDIFRINSKFGYRAFNDHWFYSLTFMFKTQLLQSYPANSRKLTSSFLSPGEINVGVGMTYDFKSKNGKRTLNASISPLAWNLKTCIDADVNPTAFGIDAGKKVKNQLGTTVEIKYNWVMTKNISYASRLYMFTDYNYVQGDWENTFNFEINRFLSTKLFIHLRYDSSTHPVPEASWRYWQLKEILSLGFSYKFNTGA